MVTPLPGWKRQAFHSMPEICHARGLVHDASHALAQIDHVDNQTAVRAYLDAAQTLIEAARRALRPPVDTRSPLQQALRPAVSSTTTSPETS